MSRFRVVYAATYVGELTIEADNYEAARDAAVDQIDPEGEALSNDGTRLEFCEGRVTRVDREDAA